MRRVVRSSTAPSTRHRHVRVALKDPFQYQPAEGANPERDFALLYANCTSFSPKIQSYLFSKNCRKAFSGFCFVETKVKPEKVHSIKELFEHHQLHVACNAGQPSSAGEDGIHGGELIGVNNNLNFKGIDQKILNAFLRKLGPPFDLLPVFLGLRGAASFF